METQARKLMAGPGDLVRTIAATLGIPEPTVVQHDRNLFAAGLRSKGGRGRSAAKVTARDAARLLVGVMGSHLVKDTVVAVQRYIATRPMLDFDPGDKGWTDFDLLPGLSDLPAEHSFVDAIETLISRFDMLEPKLIGPSLEIVVQYPIAIGDVRFIGVRGRFVRYVWPRDLPENTDDVLEYLKQEAQRFQINDSDLTESKRVTGTTILKLNELLKN